LRCRARIRNATHSAQRHDFGCVALRLQLTVSEMSLLFFHQPKRLRVLAFLQRFLYLSQCARFDAERRTGGAKNRRRGLG
jgi:hypothetical protein